MKDRERLLVTVTEGMKVMDAGNQLIPTSIHGPCHRKGARPD